MARLINLANLEQFAAINLTADPGYDPSNRRIPNTAQITLRWANAAGKSVHNVLAGSYAGPFVGTQVQADAILTALTSGAQWTALQAFLSSDSGLTGVTIRDLNQEDQPIISSIGGGGGGSSASPELPDEVAFVITKRTAFTGPAHRGRIYIPGWATNALGTGNTVIAGAVTAAAGWASIIAGVLSAQGYTFGIAHYSRVAYTGVNGKPHAARPAGLVPITNVTALDNHWDTQRRRGLN